MNIEILEILSIIYMIYNIIYSNAEVQEGISCWACRTVMFTVLSTDDVVVKMEKLGDHIAVMFCIKTPEISGKSFHSLLRE